MVTRVSIAAQSHTQLIGIDDGWTDAFGRLRVSNPATLFESSFAYDLQPLLFEQITASGGSVAFDEPLRSAILSTDGTSGSLAAMQTYQYWPYEKGKSQLIKMTFVFGQATPGVTRRAGYFDAANGFYLEQAGGEVALVRRSSTGGNLVETRVLQSDWNCDRLDGKGHSKNVLDLSLAQILVIDGQWLGVGRVRIGLNIDGITHYIHEFLHSNRETVAPYTQTFTLPIRYEIQATATSEPSGLQAICAEVESEGGLDAPIGYQSAAANETDVATGTSPVPVLSIRPALNFPDGGITNRSFIVPGSIDLMVVGSDCLVDIQYNAVLSGGTWTRANPHSAVEFGVGQALVTPGLAAQRLLVVAGERNNLANAAGASVSSQYPLTLDAAGENARGMTIVAKTLAGTGTIRAAIGWREIR